MVDHEYLHSNMMYSTQSCRYLQGRTGVHRSRREYMYAQYAAGEYEEYILVGGDARSGDTVEEHLVEQSNSHPSPRDDRCGVSGAPWD